MERNYFNIYQQFCAFEQEAGRNVPDYPQWLQWFLNSNVTNRQIEHQVEHQDGQQLLPTLENNETGKKRTVKKAYT